MIQKIKFPVTGILLSSDWGNFQCDFRYHWKGLLCNLPSGTVFSKEANVPMSDMSFIGVKTNDFLMEIV